MNYSLEYLIAEQEVARELARKIVDEEKKKIYERLERNTLLKQISSLLPFTITWKTK